ncbi:TonB-dependent receptor [Caulobacter endophyticus]|nr:TonB-dependent receptor [Caulobacter endophyticus]
MSGVLVSIRQANTRRDHNRNVMLRRLTLAASCVALMAGAAPVLAAETPAAPEPALATADDAVGLDAVVVTARRRDEDAQTVPVAVSAFGGAQLEAARAFNVRDLQTLSPSLSVSVTNPRNTSINIRGLGNNVSVYNDGLQSAVGVYLDQVYLGRPGQAVFDLADLDSVQVLRGPQGTLFGKNTSAGALVIATKEPKFTPEFNADVTGGNYDYFQAHLIASGPIVEDKLAYRVSLANTQRGGYMTNVYDGSKTQDYHDFGGRVQFLLTPNENLSIKLSGDYGQQYSNTAAAVLTGLFTNYADSGAAYPNGYLARAARVGFTPPPIDPEARRVSVNTKNSYFETHGGVSAIVDYKLADATITSVTAWRGWHWRPHNDADGTTVSAIIDAHQDNDQQQFSQELRIRSEGERKLDYVAGLYYFWQDLEAEAVNYYGSAAADWLLAPAAASATVRAAALNNYSIVSHSSPETTSAAAFAQGTWHVTDRFDVTGGLRYTYEKMTGWFDQTAWGADLSGLSAADQATALALRARFGAANKFASKTSGDSLTGNITLAYTFDNGPLVYATYARGYKAGGLNLSNINTSGANAVDPVIAPETIDAYEAGLKSTWFDRRLTANLALFWTEDDGYQTTAVNLINNASYLTNAGSVRSRGVELDLRAAPVQGLTLYGSTTYNDASYTSYEQAACPIEIQLATYCNLTGRRLPGASLWAASTGGEYRKAAGTWRSDGLVAYAGYDASYKSSYYTSASNSEYSKIKGYTLLNLRAGIGAEDGSWDLQVWGRNVFDKLYYLSLGAANTGAITGTLGDPRTFGVTLRVRR